MDKNDRHNLLYLVGTLGMGGAEMLLLHYSQALGNDKFNHNVYCFGIDGPIRPLLEDLGVSVALGPQVESIKNPFKFAFSLFALFKSLLKFIKQNKIHTIHSHNPQSDKLAVVVGKLTGIPAFPTIHNTMFTVDRRSKFDPRMYLVKAVDHIIYRIADRVIAVSEEVKDVICTRYNLEKSKVVVVKNGIYFNPLSNNSIRTSSDSAQHNDGLKLFAVGRLAYQKNFEVLIKATDYLLKIGYKNIRVQIAGQGEEYQMLLTLIQDLHLERHVELLGIRSDVLELMQGADLFVMPSRYEGLSIAMIEALACGLPVIASDAPGLRDYIRNNQNGMLFPIGDYKSMAECISKISEDKNLHIQLSQGAQESFLENFDMRRNIEPLTQLMSDFRV
jgi:glycosyltransferase involved in cell wall biosynthesis